MAADGLFLDGRPLLLDADAQVVSFLNDWLSQEWARNVPPRSHVQGDARTWQTNPLVPPLPLANYPPRPQVGINQLYWPTGATRWAQGYFLCTSKDASHFHDQAHNQPADAGWDMPRGRDLVLRAQFGGRSIETRVFLLAQRPLSGEVRTVLSKNRLALLTLVDARYYWQQVGLGAPPTRVSPGTVSGLGGPVVVTENTTWGGLWDAMVPSVEWIGEGTNVFSRDAISADLLKPDAASWNAHHFENAAVCLDALAHSVGCRVIRKLGGEVVLRNTTKSEIDRDASLLIDRSEIAGGQFSTIPDSERIVVAFPKVISGHLDCDDYHYMEVRNWGDSAAVEPIDPTCNLYSQAVNTNRASGIRGATDVIFSTAYASFADADTACPTNQDALVALAKRIGTDYWKYHAIGTPLLSSQLLDVTLEGLHSWDISGFDDFVLFDFGTERRAVTSIESPDFEDEGAPLPQLVSSRGRRLTTRVRGMPQGHGARYQLSQDTTVPLVKEPCFRILDTGSSSSSSSGWQSTSGAVTPGPALRPNKCATAEYVVVDKDTGKASPADPYLTVEICDRKHCVFAIPGEVIPAGWNCTHKRWETVAPFGFPRFGKLVANIGACQAGWMEVHTWQPTSSSSSGGSSGEPCHIAPSGYLLRVRNPHDITLKSGKEMLAHLVAGFGCVPLVEPFSFTRCPPPAPVQ